MSACCCKSAVWFTYVISPEFESCWVAHKDLLQDITCRKCNLGTKATSAGQYVMRDAVAGVKAC